MKRIRNVILSIFFVFVMFVSIEDVKAIGNITIKWEYDSILENSSKIWLEGDLDDDKGYFVKFVKDNESAPNIPQNRFDIEYGMMQNNEFDLNKWFVANNAGTTKDYVINIYNNFYMYDGYNGAYVIECSDTSCSMSSRLNLVKPPLPDYGKRYVFYFHDYKLSIDPQYQTGYLVFDINIKLGIIEDEQLVKKVLNDYDGSRLELFNYAKTASNGTIFKSKTFNEVPIDDFEIKECKLYYAYVLNDTSNGKYIEVPDVYAVLGQNDTSNGSLILSDNLNYYADNCGVKLNNNVNNPKTTDTNIIMISLFMILIVFILTLSLKKLKKADK